MTSVVKMMIKLVLKCIQWPGTLSWEETSTLYNLIHWFYQLYPTERLQNRLFQVCSNSHLIIVFRSI